MVVGVVERFERFERFEVLAPLAPLAPRRGTEHTRVEWAFRNRRSTR